MTLLLRNVQRIVKVNMMQVRDDVTLLRQLVAAERFDLGVLLVDDFYIQDINKRFRGKDEATDVLSFPFHENLREGELPDGTEEEDEMNLGDLILGMPTIARQAKQSDVDVHDMITIVVTHGLCHLIGYDHKEADKWKRMYQRELQILNEFNKATGSKLTPLSQFAH